MLKRSSGFLSVLVLALFCLSCTPKPKPAEEPTAPAASQTPAADSTAALPTPTPPEKPPAGKAMRIVAWNLEWFPGKKPDPAPEAERQQMASAKAALAKLRPDVLLLAEIRDWDKAQELCQAVPGLQVHVVSRFDTRPQNQVVASTFPADSGWSDLWKTDAVTPPRGYSFAALELPGRRFLLAYALHLKSNLGELSTNIALRHAATRQLLTHIHEMLAIYSQRGPVAVVIGGDLNTSLDDPKFSEDQTLRALTAAGFHWTHQGVPFAQRTTIPASGPFPDNCFDHIFTAGLGQPAATVQAFPDISDHNPVILDVDLVKADFQPKIDPAPGLALLPRAEPPKAPETLAGTLPANNLDGIKAAAGKISTVHGRVQNVGATPAGNLHFINFTGVPRGGFVGLIRQANHDTIAAAFGGDLKSALTGKTVTLRGEIVLFRETPQIVITTADQIQILDR